MRRNGSAIERLPVTDIMFLLEEQTADPQTIALLAAFGSTDRRPSGEELASTIAHTVAGRAGAPPARPLAALVAGPAAVGGRRPL